MFPYLPITPSNEGGLSFIHTETGETLHFDKSWMTNLDKVEAILMDNHHGNYTIDPITDEDMD